MQTLISPIATSASFFGQVTVAQPHLFELGGVAFESPDKEVNVSVGDLVNVIATIAGAGHKWRALQIYISSKALIDVPTVAVLAEQANAQVDATAGVSNTVVEAAAPQATPQVNKSTAQPSSKASNAGSGFNFGQNKTTLQAPAAVAAKTPTPATASTPAGTQMGTGQKPASGLFATTQTKKPETKAHVPRVQPKPPAPLAQRGTSRPASQPSPSQSAQPQQNSTSTAVPGQGGQVRKQPTPPANVRSGGGFKTVQDTQGQHQESPAPNQQESTTGRGTFGGADRDDRLASMSLTSYDVNAEIPF